MRLAVVLAGPAGVLYWRRQLSMTDSGLAESVAPELLREKVEVRGVGLYSQCDTKAQLAEQMLRDLCDIEPTQDQIKQAETLMMAQMSGTRCAHGSGPITIDAVPIGRGLNGRNR